MLIILIILLVILIAYSIFTTMGMIKGMRKSEEYEDWIEKTKVKIVDAYNKMKDVDTIGAFESDDETGMIFQDIRDIVTEINEHMNLGMEISTYDEKNNNIKRTSI